MSMRNLRRVPCLYAVLSDTSWDVDITGAWIVQLSSLGLSAPKGYGSAASRHRHKQYSTFRKGVPL